MTELKDQLPSAVQKYVYYSEPGIVLLHGDCLEIMPLLESNSIDTIITDPPYGISFMGKNWDHVVPGPQYWEIALKICKPGALMLAFGGTRTHHRLMCSIEDGGWELRDVLMWLYGSGFPKSHNISKAIDKEAGAERKKILASSKGGKIISGSNNSRPWHENPDHLIDSDQPVTPEAKKWDGYGTALKPAWEPIILAMNPLDGTFAQNAIKYGLAGLNIDDCKIAGPLWKWGTQTDIKGGGYGNKRPSDGYIKDKNIKGGERGRWPSNILLTEETATMLDKQSGPVKAGGSLSGNELSHPFKNCYGEMKNRRIWNGYEDSGGASRFFYISKADNKDRGNRPEKEMPLFGEKIPEFKNTHPTVKPTTLAYHLLNIASYLARLTASPNAGIVLDMFGGSGWMPLVCKSINRPCIMIEKEIENIKIAIERIRQK